MQQYYRLCVRDNCSRKWNALVHCLTLGGAIMIEHLTLLYPNLIPDFSSGSPLIVSGRYNGNFPDFVKASGLLPDMSNFIVELEVQKSKGIPQFLSFFFFFFFLGTNG